MNDNIIQYVLAAGNGDTDAMAKLYAGTLKGSYFLASKLCDSDEEAADITRRAYAKVFCTIDKLKKPEAFEIWMKQMIASIYKESRKFVFADADAGAHEPDSDFLPEAILSNEADAEKVIAAVAGLSPERRTAIILHYNNGMPVAVLSKFLGVSESTANAILSKARSEIVENSGVKPPEYPELSTLPVLTRLFRQLAAEVKIDSNVVREMFIFILDCVEAAKPAEAVEEKEEIAEETVEETTAAEEVTEEVMEESSEENDSEEAAEEVSEETEEISEEAETESEEETVAKEETEEPEEAEETESVEEIIEVEELPEEEAIPEETAEEAVDKIEEELVSFKDRISTLIGADEKAEEETVSEEIEEVEESFEIEEETPEESAAEETENQEDNLLDAIRRSMDDLNDFAESGEVVELDEDTGSISFATYKKEEEFKAEEPVLPVEEEKKSAEKFASDKKKPAIDKKVAVIIAAIVILIIAVVAVVIGVSAGKKDDPATDTTASQKAKIASEWKEIEALNAYSSIKYLNEDYAVFEKDGKFGLIDNFGNVVLNAKYDGFKMCSKGKDYEGEGGYHILAVSGGKNYEVSVTNGVPAVTTKEHVSHATDTEKTVSNDNYVERDRYFEGYAAVQNVDGKWGYVAKDSDMLVIDYLYDAPNAYSPAADSCRGFDKGCVAVKKDGKMGIVDIDGDVVVAFEYEEILQGDEGVYVAKKDGKWGHILVGDEAIAYYSDYQVKTEAEGDAGANETLGEPVGTYTAKDDINVRSGPSSEYEKIGTINKGATIKVYEIRKSENKNDKNDFAKVEINGQLGWASMGLLEKK